MTDQERIDEGERLVRAVTETPGCLRVCMGCGGIVRDTAAICPACEAYRFEEEPERVIQHIREIAARPENSVK